MTTPNPSRSVSPEPTKGEEAEAIRLAIEHDWVNSTESDGTTICEVDAFVDGYVLASETMRAAYIPLVEAAERWAQRRTDVLQGYVEMWTDDEVEVSKIATEAAANDLVRAIDALSDALVQVPVTTDSEVARLRAALETIRDNHGAGPFPHEFEASATHCYRCVAAAALVQVPGHEQADTAQGGG